jgi:hypothetical protein
VYTTHLGDFSVTSVNGEGTGVVVAGVAVDGEGSAYITGYVNKVGLLPIVNALQPAYGGMGDAFVGKLKPDGSEFVYLTYLGGGRKDIGWKIAVDPEGNAYVTGDTCSIDFPTVNAAQASLSGANGCDAFVAKLDSTGSALVYSTHLGGAVAIGLIYALPGNLFPKALTTDTAGGSFPRAIATDTTGNIYLGGIASSCDYGSYLCSDAIITKLNNSGAIVYSTTLGGSGFDWATGIAADAAGNAYVTGITGSCDFPTVNAFQPSSGDYGGRCGDDAFVAKVDSEGRLVYATYLGGNGADHGSAITVDKQGNAYVSGSVGSLDFPTKNSLQEPANNAGFVTKLDASGSALLFSTYFGDAWEERNIEAYGIGADAAGNIYVAGAVIGGSASGAFVLKIDSTIFHEEHKKRAIRRSPAARPELPAAIRTRSMTHRFL